MKEYQITEFLHINGIGSASGLIYHQNVLFIISDNSTFLYQYVIDKELLLKLPLLENAQENIAKKDKLDLEALTHIGNQIFIFGSGSTAQRNTMFSLHLENDAIQKIDLAVLYLSLRELAKLKENELNIEGAICVENAMFLFQRGNALNSKNGIFIIPDITTSAKQFVPISLPKIGNIEVSFTDAVLVENFIYFLATAEDTVSTYDDGTVLGSLIGKMDFRTFEVIETQVISTTQKFEGITLLKKNDKEIDFLLCEDNDTDILESKIYKLTLKI